MQHTQSGLFRVQASKDKLIKMRYIQHDEQFPLKKHDEQIELKILATNSPIRFNMVKTNDQIWTFQPKELG